MNRNTNRKKNKEIMGFLRRVLEKEESELPRSITVKFVSCPECGAILPDNRLISVEIIKSDVVAWLTGMCSPCEWVYQQKKLSEEQ